MAQGTQVQRHHNGLRHKKEVDLTEQRTNQNLQSVTPAETPPIIAIMQFAITTNSRIIQEKRSVLTATGYTNLRIVRR